MYVPDEPQRVEYLIDSITCSDNTLQAAIGLVRANTNKMREDFEKAVSTLIEVDPFRLSNKSGGNPCEAQVGALDFSAGRGESGVDLCWHPTKDFKALSSEHQSELKEFMRSPEGKKMMHKSRAAAGKRKRGDDSGGNDKDKSNPSNPSTNWKEKMKKALKTPQGLRSVMAIMAEEEQLNNGFVAALQSTTPAPGTTPSTTPNPTPPVQASAVHARFPTTSVKLQSILKPSQSLSK